MTEGGDQTLKLQQIRILLSQLRGWRVRTRLQNARIFPGIDRKPMITIADIELTAVRAKDQS